MQTQQNQAVSVNNLLNERYREILSLLVTDYIATSDAVGSRQLSKKILRRLSPATIRNVMADLEEMGYLTHAHTSAGRVPTQKGLRYYVDSLVEKRPLTEDERKSIQDHYKVGGKDIRRVMQQTGKILAAFSQCVGLVLTPNWKKTIFKHIEFLPLSRGRLLGIFVSQNGMVENRILEIGEELNYRELEKINNYCNASFVGLTLEEAREKVVKEFSKAQGEYDKLLSKALLLSQNLLMGIETNELVVEFSTIEKTKGLMQSLEEKQQLLKVLDSCLDSAGVRIFIGAESRLEPVKDLSLVTATYTEGNRILGTLGVIGPTSMDYSRVIPMVDFTAKLVTDFLENKDI
ncbi:MAG: heat-inducible transcription repressor HrcA [Deltaproteobacteria bacterium RIFCSPLOWO2_01_44_7]|nr:MAG: heat-inducible transcription repressor HrcA [Deltaproteobacteria bacterium RIFCSPHIGHO2_01_FULL_43_49]OGQ14595.1 MAG: heat-inducible transcription repressor HrcA [Deltaproteobacteria bacterium RIFCSPHIGHO2_02_FULL_44_53]OGQ27981.1 MAG: heat-inducible transcription repressor HrcA [Deltaproteobacteria bacterium RIFCSPHIGHO2_12_FULL_44_21]OGQ31193.1 MAG: heat-inducible transcription repressor HrcA [Deltaproteobacteria bacterium RIFCSPLOWO2_01_FULL_45_74]OGQ37980.1 MAG: heat-inducible trans